jgi:hypothetical protein
VDSSAGWLGAASAHDGGGHADTTHVGLLPRQRGACRCGLAGVSPVPRTVAILAEAGPKHLARGLARLRPSSFTARFPESFRPAMGTVGLGDVPGR